MPKLGVNIDHVATLRQARGGNEPDPVAAAHICEQAGADSIVCHLREDRRHVHDRDVRQLRRTVKTRLNLEMSLAPDIVRVAAAVRPDEATFVPERRREVTTEGGLDVARSARKIERAVKTLKAKGIQINLFIDPVKTHIRLAAELGADMIELHTGKYALARTPAGRKREYEKIRTMTRFGLDLGLTVNAGHGLDYQNTRRIAQIKGITELNIGHSIISRAVFSGLNQAVKDMIKLART